MRLDFKNRAGFAFLQNLASPKNARARLDLGLNSGLNLQKLSLIWESLTGFTIENPVKINDLIGCLIRGGFGAGF